jgi:hypothetical protein
VVRWCRLSPAVLRVLPSSHWRSARHSRLPPPSLRTVSSVISIANETNANISVVYHWGDGQEKTYRFAPGARQWFSYAYSRPDENRSPDFHIKFDADSTNQRYSEFKKLHGYRAPDQSYNLGHEYVFKYDGPAKRFIEIYDRK